MSQFISRKLRKIIRKGINLFKLKKIDIYKMESKKIEIQAPKKISIVIPNYNYVEYIEQRIDSVLYQSYPIYEIIILDDCSTDNSVEVINEKIKKIKQENNDIKIEFIINKENGENVFSQWQKGFNAATGEYVWIAEADDLASPDFLNTVIKGFEKNEGRNNVILSYSNSMTIDKNNKILTKTVEKWADTYNTGKWHNDYINDGKEEIRTTLSIKNTIFNVSSCLIKKGNYDEIFTNAKGYRLAGDWYFYYRLLELGDIAYFATPLNYYRIHNKRVTSNTKTEKEYEEIRTIHKYAKDNYDLTDDVKEKMSKFELLYTK